jgi:hypothetical protein
MKNEFLLGIPCGNCELDASVPLNDGLEESEAKETK